MIKISSYAAPIAVFLIAIATCTVASTIPKHNKASPLHEYLDDLSITDPQDYAFVNGYPLRQTRRGLDSLSGATFGESKRGGPARMVQIGNYDELDRYVPDRFAKRNIDEIDRTAFDSFLKRNLDEIDRVGWSSFVKRLDSYLNDRQMR